MNAQQAASTGEMASQPTSGRDHPLRRAGLSGVADVDDEQADVSRVGQRVLHLTGDVDAVAEALEDRRQPSRGGGEVVPRVEVGSGPAHDQGVRHRAS